MDLTTGSSNRRIEHRALFKLQVESAALFCLQVCFEELCHFLRKAVGGCWGDQLCCMPGSLLRTQGDFITAQTMHMKKVSSF